MISQSVLAASSTLRQQFQHAQPFRFVVIDNFLREEAAEQLLRDFPPFDTKRALTETGTIGRKATLENVSRVSAFYKSFYHHINSKPFLDSISTLTGIDQLIADETLFGGGTHESLHGQELDPHIDFNIDRRRWLHRRLNLLLYLNKEWEVEWGGALELHSNPREATTNEVISILPIYNRCVIFETSEYSWHGFSIIRLPEDKRHLSRKSFSIYLYTKERPAAEVAPSHTTFYVSRPVPAHLQPGYTLTQEDCEAIRTLLARRDGLLRFYHELLIEKEKMLGRIIGLKRTSVHLPPALSSRVWRMLLTYAQIKGRIARALRR